MMSFGFRHLLISLTTFLVTMGPVATEGRALGLEGLFNNLRGTVEGMVDNVNGAVAETLQHTSVLSSFFGSDITRKDLTLPQIVGSVFSRNNPIAVPGSTSKETTVAVGDGSFFVATVTSGGAMSVTSENGTVTVSTMAPSQSKNAGPQLPPHFPDVQDGELDNKGGVDVKESAEPEDEHRLEQHEKDSSSGPLAKQRAMTETFIELVSNWKSYVLSSMWDEQDKFNAGKVGNGDQQTSKLQPASSRIVNGIFLENWLATGAPFSVRFFFDEERNFYCSGSLISHSHVLTAAHCGVIVGDSVRIGGRLLRSGLNGTISAVFTHPSFSAHSLAYDLAIVELDGLSEIVSKHEDIMPARVNNRKLVPSSDFVGVVSAHGATHADGGEISQVILSTRQRVLELAECQEEIQQGRVGNDGSFVCVGDGIRSTTCVGDSGAGLWHVRTKMGNNGQKKWYYEVVAVVSFGEVTDDALCPNGKPAVFQRTATSYEWIKGIIESPLKLN